MRERDKSEVVVMEKAKGVVLNDPLFRRHQFFIGLLPVIEVSFAVGMSLFVLVFGRQTSFGGSRG